MKKQKFIEEKMIAIENDLERIRTKPRVYISYLEEKGIVHLIKEMINNGIDEALNPNSPANHIKITIDERTNKAIVEDNGRGFPFDSLIKSCTVMHSSTKFTRSVGGESAGENGLGLTACNAMSKEFSIEVYKLGEYAKLSYIDGVMIDDGSIQKISDTKKHGSIVTYVPEEKYMLTELINTEMLGEWLDNIQHLLSNKIKLSYTVIDLEGKKSKITLEKGRGLYDIVDKMSSDKIFSPIHLKDSVKFKEDNIRNVDTGELESLERFMGIDYAFSYRRPKLDGSVEELAVKSFCNFVHTIDDGTHVDAVRNSLCNYIIKATKSIMSEKDLAKYDILNIDVTTGLLLSVYLVTDTNPGFTNQTKEKVLRQEIYKKIADLTRLSLNDYFKVNPRDLKKICDYVKSMAKSRVEASKTRVKHIKDETSKMSEHKIDGYVPANIKTKKAYREIFLIEGLSVEGNALKARYEELQALFSFRGVPTNTYGMSLSKVLEGLSGIFKNLIRALKCNIGPNFDINKLNFAKIIIMADSDVDGDFITSILCAFFLFHLPEVVKAGFLYRVLPPLYKLDDKDKKFVQNKKQQIEVFEKRIGNNLRLVDLEGKVIKGKDFSEFLFKNRLYLSELVRLSKHFTVHQSLIEFVLYNKEDYKKKLNAYFPEMQVDKSDDPNVTILSGVIEGKGQILFVDDIFYKKSEVMMDYIYKVNNAEYYTILERSGRDYIDKGVHSIGDFFHMAQKFNVDIEMRYKGLGELSSKDLQETVFNPNNRMLVQLTVDDIESDLSRFDILHGKGDKEREQMMKMFKIDRELIDN